MFKVAVISLILAWLGINPSGFASSNPYAQGTEAVRLSEEERHNLLQFVNHSEKLLAEALAEASNRPFASANEIYSTVVKQVVLDSYQERSRSELLMRHILNQAMQFTVGVPSSDGKSFVQSGVLDGAANEGLITIILEDSIKLALKYVEKDVYAVKSDTLLELPYLEVASARLIMAGEWASAIPQTHRRYEFYRAALHNWLAAASNAEQFRQAKVAAEISKIDAVLKNVESSSKMLIGEKVRVLRNAFRSLNSAMVDKYPSASDIAKAIMRNPPAETFESDSDAPDAPVQNAPHALKFELGKLDRRNDPANLSIEARAGAYSISGSGNRHGVSLALKAQTSIAYSDGLKGLNFRVSGRARADYNVATNSLDRAHVDVFGSPFHIGLGPQGEHDDRPVSAGISLFPGRYRYEKIHSLGWMDQGASIGWMAAYVTVATHLAGVDLTLGADFSPYEPMTNSMKLNDDGYLNWAGSRYLQGSAHVKADLGFAELANYFSHDAATQSFTDPNTAATGQANLRQIGNWVGLERIAGTPIGIGYNFDFVELHVSGRDARENLQPDYSQNASRSMRQHMLTVKGTF